ncbi:hypothetical protein GIB67_023077 [Kingdonia uniflora]|uniref:Uncharacterized protein n=1 Tax=Kingdonia uniflora TaxID=39325 RepID=A0A7J7P801_9MAGN|nr:hypothetical protein GIB67_023077 [Kingdonia uniflora]
MPQEVPWRRLLSTVRSMPSTDLRPLKKIRSQFMSNSRLGIQRMLSKLILAANNLNIKDFLDLSCQTVADMRSSLEDKRVRHKDRP